MSYDLFFYKRKNNNLTTEQIGTYLSNKLTPVNEHGKQWFFENKDTGVYYIFETIDADETEEEELPDSLKDFVHTGILFNLNFIRPSFFGEEAFRFVETFINDLDLYVVNPQGDDYAPGKPNKQLLFENWNKTNLWASKEHFDDRFLFYPIDKSNKVWEHNYNRKRIQDEVGEYCFVSRIFFFKETQTNKVVTVSMWTEHIPNILPITDYYLLGKKYKKLFITFKSSVLLTRADFNATFSSYFEPYTFGETIIIHPDKAASIGKIYNRVKSNLNFKKHLKGVAADSITHVTNQDR